MLAAVAYRAADGSFLPAEPFEIKRPDDGHGESKLDAFARWAAERYRREKENKEKEEAS
jgi:hypothetical protein